MERKNLIRSALTGRGRLGRSNRAASRRGIRLAPLLLVAVMLAAVAMLAETSTPSRTAHAHDVVLTHTHGNVVCVSPPAASCPTYDDESQPGGTEIWSATMRVSSVIFGTDTLYGWSSDGIFIRSTLTEDDFTFENEAYKIVGLFVGLGGLYIEFDEDTAGDIATQATRDKLVLHVGDASYYLKTATLESDEASIFWPTDLTWSVGENIELRLTTAPTPNAYGYRTIWTALMTAGDLTGSVNFGYEKANDTGKLSADTIVLERTVRGVIDDKFRYPWNGYEILTLTHGATDTDLSFDSDSYPSADEVAGWTLVVDGKELPFAGATNPHVNLPNVWNFTYAPNPAWTDKQQLLVSIRTKEVQNRFGQVDLKAGRSTRTHGDNNIVYGKSHYTYARGTSRFGPEGSWELQNLRVTIDQTDDGDPKTGDDDPVWITATFRAPNESVSWQGYWEGQFDDFHTLFLRWIYQVDGIGEGAATYTLPLRTAATEGGIQRSRSGRDISFTWVRTYKEFQRRHLDLANHTTIFADFLAPPKPATARSTTTIQNTGSQHGLYTPAPTVTSVEITSNPGDDQTYGPGDVIQATLTFDQEVTVRYTGSKRQAASLELEMDGETRTAYYERTDGKKVIFEYTVLPGDEAPVALRLPLNSLKLFSERGRQDGSIQNSEGADAVLDHNGILSTKHRGGRSCPGVLQRPGFQRRRPGGGHLQRGHPVSGHPESLRRPDEPAPEPGAGR